MRLPPGPAAPNCDLQGDRSGVKRDIGNAVACEAEWARIDYLQMIAEQIFRPAGAV